MNNRKIVIIGGGTAGVTAAMNARHMDVSAEITVLSNEETMAYRRPSLCAIIQGTVLNISDIAIYPRQIIDSQEINWITGTEVFSIDRCQKRVSKNAYIYNYFFLTP